jgi:protein tyrosine phosphatase
MFQNIMDVGGNTVIHCSAGVGRTGVMYICLKIKKWLNDYIKNNPTPNIEKIIERINLELLNARRSRMWLVQKVEQYIFIHKIFIDELSDIDDDNDDNDLIIKIKINYKSIYPELDKPVDSKKYEKQQNRYSNILPYEYNIPWLNDGEHIPKNYINASIMKNFDDKTNINNDDKTNINNDVFGNGMMVITAECPKPKEPDSKGPDSINNFRKMLVQYDIKRIIMLTNMIEDKKLKCNDYTLTGSLTQTSNNNSQSQNNGNGYEIIMFQIPLDMPKMVNSVAGGYRKKNNSHINKNKLNKSRKHIKKYNLL